MTDPARIATTLTAIAAAGGAIAAVLAYPVRIYNGLIAAIRPFYAVPRAVVVWFREQSQAAKDIKRIVKEVTPNGGGSMKDAVLAIRAEQLVAMQRHRVILNDDHDGWFEANGSGIVWVNRTFCRTIGRQIEELMGRGWINAVAPAERDAVAAGWQMAVDYGTEFSRDVTYISADGKRVVCNVHSYVIRDVTGKPVAHHGWLRLLSPEKGQS